MLCAVTCALGSAQPPSYRHTRSPIADLPSALRPIPRALQLSSAPQAGLKQHAQVPQRRQSARPAIDTNQIAGEQESRGNKYPRPPLQTGPTVDRPNPESDEARGQSRPLNPIRLVSNEEDWEMIPVPVEPAPKDVDLEPEQGGLFALNANEAQLRDVLRLIASHHDLNLVMGPDVGGPVTVTIRGARMDEVLDAILGVAGFSWHQVDNLLYVTSAAATGMDPRVQGRTLHVYPLDYVAAADVEAVAAGLLSPVGSSFISESDSADQRRTREVLVVEDTSAGHARVAQYLAQNC